MRRSLRSRLLPSPLASTSAAHCALMSLYGVLVVMRAAPRSSPASMKVARGGAASSALKSSAVFVALLINPLVSEADPTPPMPASLTPAPTEASASSTEASAALSVEALVAALAEAEAEAAAALAAAAEAERSISISSASSLMPSFQAPPPLPAAALNTRSAPKRSILSSSLVDRVSNSAAAAVLPRFTIWSRYSLRSARCWMRSSTVPSVHSRYTCTGLVCPMRCTRAMA
mmetsp:Transcript_16624/g.40731  ORF Transcript_16624/g.40731 Transcript_16624/m.40731 type:complete len:231 (+) Transcript_16624:978-1670(+)